jgi:hypothetical protein
MKMEFFRPFYLLYLDRLVVKTQLNILFSVNLVEDLGNPLQKIWSTQFAAV